MHPSVQSCAEPKHVYDIESGCSVSKLKEVRAGGRTLFWFQVEWPVSHTAKEEGDGGESSRCVTGVLASGFCFSTISTEC